MAKCNQLTPLPFKGLTSARASFQQLCNSRSPTYSCRLPSWQFVRPPDIHVARLIFYQYFFLSSFFLFFRQLISELAERNWTEIGHILGSNCDLKTQRMSKIWSIPSPYKSGPKNHLLGPTLQLNGNLNGLYLRNETGYRQSVKSVDNYEGSATSSQNVMNLVHRRLQIGPPFLPTYVNSAFCVIARLHRRRSANRTHWWIYTVSQKNDHIFIFQITLSTINRFLWFWCVKSWENLTSVACTLAHFTCIL